MWQKNLHIFSSIVLSAVIVTALAAAVRVQAATVTNANDSVSTLQSSQTANHSLLFTTSSGVSEGSTVTVHFDSAFTSSSLVEDDIDVADDGVELTTASNCSGTEKASVAIATNTITVTICAGDGGAIAGGSIVRVKIGTNAVSSGIGSHKITNPSSVGTYFISIAGSFGDSGSIALPIHSGIDGIPVTAFVPSTGGSGGSVPPTPSSDVIAPVISNVVVSGITKSSVLVSWNTDENATSEIKYGLTNSFELGTLNDAALVKSHSFSLVGLSEGKTYFFRVKSKDASNNEGSSAILTFATIDQTAPAISNILVDAITKSSATIHWSTNENATGVLDYGLTTGYGSTKSDAGFASIHTFVVTGLSKATVYHFRVTSSDTSSNTSLSSDETFQTLADLPPSNVSGMKATPGDKSVLLEWTNPIVDDFAGVRILQCLGAYPNGPTDSKCAIIADNSQATSLNKTGLLNGTTYFYGVFAKDLAGQFSSGALVLGKPSAPEKEVLPPNPVTPEPVPVKAPGTEPGKTGSETTNSQPAAGGLAVSCGDGMCSGSESAFTCPSDCKQGQNPSIGTTGNAFSFADVTIAAGSGAIVLPHKNGIVEVLPNTELTIRVPATALGTGVDHVTIMIGPDTFIMRSVTALGLSSLQSGLHVRVAAVGSGANVLSYEADVSTPSKQSLHPVTVFADYKDGKTINVSSFLRVVAPGFTHEIIDGEEASVSGVPVTLYSVIGSKSIAWDGSPYGEFNPTTSTSDGTIGWYVPNGQYRVHAEKDGYKPLDTAVFTVSNFIATPHMVLVAFPKKVIVSPEPANVSDLPLAALSTIGSTIKSIAALPAIKTIQQNIETIRQTQGVQTAAQVSLPVLAVSAGASVVIMTVAFDFLPFIQYLFTAPLLFLGRKKRKGYGVIYNAISKEPIGLAVVRLFQLQNELDVKGRLVKSRVTDKGGRFFFLVQPGLYRLSILKNGFQFPSELMKSKKEDVQYIDLYHGEFVKVTEAGAMLTPNIPLDPSSAGQYHEPKQIILRARLQVIQHIVAFLGTVASVVFLIIRPSVLAVGMVLIQLAVYFAANYLAKPRKPKSWGIVYDEKTGRPVANAVARIFEPKYNKLLETQVTDNKGRYSFLLGPAEYFAVFEKEGYRSTQVNPIDYTKVDGAKDFSSDIKLIEKENKKS